MLAMYNVLITAFYLDDDAIVTHIPNCSILN